MNKEDIYKEIQVNNIIENKYPWFIKEYKGRAIVTIKDIKELLGLHIDLKKINNKNNILRGKDWNGIGKGEVREEFARINNVNYKDDTIFFVYITGFLKILKVLIEDNKIELLDAENILREIDRNNIKYIL